MFSALINFVLSLLYESNEHSEINESISDFISRVEHGLQSIQPKSDRTFSSESKVTAPPNVATVSVRSPRGGVGD